jgi:predicted site-specific integrase-resolvase
MPKLSISEAARQVPISRKTLYQSYINKGKISTSKSDNGKPTIDTSELLRVFPNLKGKQPEVTVVEPQGDSSKTEVLREKINGLEAILKEKERLLDLKDELIANQKQQLMLLGFNKAPRKKIFGLF